MKIEEKFKVIFSTTIYEESFAKMAKLAEKECICFMNWTLKEGWTLWGNGNDLENRFWRLETKTLTVEELFQLYLKSKENSNQPDGKELYSKVQIVDIKQAVISWRNRVGNPQLYFDDYLSKNGYQIIKIKI